jgi:hypothetical protein
MNFVAHDRKSDYTCRRCGMFVRTFILHECDPSICETCDGFKTKYVGRDPRNDNKWVGFITCPDCNGTGRKDWEEKS